MISIKLFIIFAFIMTFGSIGSICHVLKNIHEIVIILKSIETHVQLKSKDSSLWNCIFEDGVHEGFNLNVIKSKEKTATPPKEL